MDNPISWKQEDYTRLKKAVSDFNKKIRKLEKEEGLLYLPDTKLYSETRDKITTRQEYNRQLKALQDFMKAGAEELVLTKAGERLSKWEWQQTLNQKRILENRLNKELSSLDKAKPYGARGYRLTSEKVAEAEDTLKSIQRLTKTKGEEFLRIKNRIQTLGVKDFGMRKATIYRHNLLNELKNIKASNPEFNKLYEHLEAIKNPEQFYEETKKSEVLQDFFIWYKNPMDYGSFEGYEDLTDYILHDITEANEFEDYINFLED